MRNVMLSSCVLMSALSISGCAWAQATYVTATDIQAVLQKTASAPVSDKQIRVVSIDGEYNVGVGVIHRAKMSSRDPAGALDHHQITEVYHIIEGNATFVTGGKMDNAKEAAADTELVKVLTGPTSSGTIQNGESRKVGPGDVIIIPPNTPHGFSEITSDRIVYVVLRVDPHKVLPAGYTAK